MEHTENYFLEAKSICETLDFAKIEALVNQLVQLRDRGGRLFITGVGGSAANASHAVNDFRKLCGIETYSPTDNVSELTARINDDGWEGVFAEWLKASRASSKDAIFVLSVGGGNAAAKVSVNIINAIDYAKERKLSILGIVGRDGGYTAKVADCCVLIPTVADKRVTPHTEAFQAMVWHCLVSHPKLQLRATKW